jgi:membrane fusion protein (multidrug efflux system)
MHTQLDLWRRLAHLVLISTVLLSLSAACSRSDEAASDSNGEESASVAEGDEAANGSGEDEDSKKKEKKKKKKGDEDEEEDEEEAVPIEVATLERGRIETVLRFSTNLEAENEVQVVSRASRQLPVVQLLVEEGDDVRKGQVLLRLQSDELSTALERTRGQLDRAEREYERQTNLHSQQLISEKTYGEATYELDQLKLALRDAQRELGYTEVRAPISGTITARHVSVGKQVTPNQALFDIVDFDSIVARVYVPEKELWRLEPGLEARVSAEAAKGVERLGSVDRIAPRVDPRSGTVKTTIAIPRSAELLPGMYVSVELVTAVNESAVLVPKKALIYDADQIFVFRLTDRDGEKRVERLLIEPRLEDRDNIEPASQLDEGDEIVIAGQAGLKNGSLVRLVGEDREEEVAEAADGDGQGAGDASADAGE